MTRHLLCKLADIAEPGSRGFSVPTCTGVVELFVVKRNGQVFGYQNVCPHTGTSLDWMPHRFLDVDQTLIICATHGALFEIDSGLCVSGPCLGETLGTVCVEQIGEEIFLIED